MAFASLEGHQVQIDDHRHYRITIDPEPADGRLNHLQTVPGTRYLFIRDCRNDWREVPDPRRIRRLDPPVARPFSEEQIANLAAALMVDDVPDMFWWIRVFRGLACNTMTEPFGSGAVGGLQSQMITFGRVFLSDEEAFVVNLTHSEADFRDIVLDDYWFNTIGDYSHHTSSMTHHQGIPNAEETTTYVIAIQDPGVHNWLNPMGLHEVLVAHRWQGLPTKTNQDRPPAANYALVKLSELETVLPSGMKRVTPTEREQQLAERQASYRLRYIDH